MMKSLRAPLAAVAALAVATPAVAQQFYGPNPEHHQGSGGPVVAGCTTLGGNAVVYAAIPNTMIELSPGNYAQAMSVVPVHLISGGRIDTSGYNRVVGTSGFDRAAERGEIPFMAPYSSGLMIQNSYPQEFPAAGEDMDGIWHTPQRDMEAVFMRMPIRDSYYSSSAFIDMSALEACTPAGQQRLENAPGINSRAPVVRDGIQVPNDTGRLRGGQRRPGG